MCLKMPIVDISIFGLSHLVLHFVISLVLNLSLGERGKKSSVSMVPHLIFFFL